MQKSLFTLRIPTEKQTKSDYVSLATLACIKASFVCVPVCLWRYSYVENQDTIWKPVFVCLFYICTPGYLHVVTMLRDLSTITVNGLFKTVKHSFFVLDQIHIHPHIYSTLPWWRSHRCMMRTRFLCILREMLPVKMSFSPVCYGPVKWESTPW